MKKNAAIFTVFLNLQYFNIYYYIVYILYLGEMRLKASRSSFNLLYI